MNVYRSCFRPTWLLFAAFTLLIFVTGCGGGGSGGSNRANDGGSGTIPGPSDNIVPSVTIMTPGEASTGMATNGRITATFSEAMLSGGSDPESVSATTFRLISGPTAIPGTISYDATNHIAVFTPSSDLVPFTTYIATIVTGIKDLGNNPITTDFAWDFVTGGLDIDAPSVSSTIPANAATDVAINRKLMARFNEDMDSSTMNTQNFTVTSPGPTPVPGRVTYLGRTAIFAPTQNLAANTVYTASITTGATDLAGNPAQAKVTSFTTGANTDSAAPVVSSTTPANTATNVAIDTAIRVSFSEPMNPSTITSAEFTLTGPGTSPVIGTVAYDTSNNSATFTRHVHLTTPVDSHLIPVSDLVTDTTYTATLTTVARDLAGNALANKRVWSFTTTP